MWQNGGSISLGSSVYRLQLTVQRMSAGDGWARISTIKMVSHPSGQENDAKPKREVGRVVQPQSNWQVERLWRGSVWDIYRGEERYPVGRCWPGLLKYRNGKRSWLRLWPRLRLRLRRSPLMLSYVPLYIPTTYYTRNTST